MLHVLDREYWIEHLALLAVAFTYNAKIVRGLLGTNQVACTNRKLPVELCQRLDGSTYNRRYHGLIG